MQLEDLKDLTVVFDLDGTLVDTAPDLAAATNHALASAGLKPLTVGQLRPLIGHGSRVMLDAGLRHHGLLLREPELNVLHERFFEYYADHVAVMSEPYAGVRDLLKALQQAGSRLAVCTNKYEHLSRALLRQLDLEPLFASIAGRDTFSVCKPDPRHLTGTIERAGGRIDRAVMVGDSEIDIATAKAAKVPAIAVTFGYTPRPVHEFAPDATIDDYAEFMAALGRVPLPVA
jgi:phosphoglycolate phosphatase